MRRNIMNIISRQIKTRNEDKSNVKNIFITLLKHYKKIMIFSIVFILNNICIDDFLLEIKVTRINIIEINYDVKT
jgi:hypothetical protein